MSATSSCNSVVDRVRNSLAAVEVLVLEAATDEIGAIFWFDVGFDAIRLRCPSSPLKGLKGVLSTEDESLRTLA